MFENEQSPQQQQVEDERYSRLMDAMREVVKAGVSNDCLDTLKFETGLFYEDLERIKNEMD